MLTILDDCSRSVWTYILNDKAQTTSVLESFLNMIETQYGKNVLMIWSDNGIEFINSQCANILSTRGIIHQRSCNYSPQQNGRVERRYKQLLQIARSLMFQFKLPMKFWSDLLLTATYIYNRLPIKLLNKKSPYEILNGRKLDYSKMKVFGSLCYTTNIQPQKSKFDQRAYRCVLLGYLIGFKAYKLYILDTKGIWILRDMVFREHIFPFHKPSDVDPDIDLPYVPVS